MAKYIVTGGAGFIGSFLTDSLIEQGHEVLVIDNYSTGQYKNPHATVINDNILNEKKIRPHFDGVDGCFHLIGIPSVVMNIKEWFYFHDNNMRSSLLVFKMAVEAGNIPVVYASSCAVYGDAKELPLKENLYVRPLSAYGCDKLAVELYAYALAKNYQLPVVGLRFFNVFGPRQNPSSPYSGVISKFIANLIIDEAPIIFGDGHQTRDFIYVKDVVQCVIQAMDLVSSNSEVINLCTGKGITINQLATVICKVMQKNIKVVHTDPRTYDVMHSVGSIEKMHAYGLEAKYDLAAGLEETVEYFLNLRSP